MHRSSFILAGAAALALWGASAPAGRADPPRPSLQTKALYAILYHPGPAWRKGLPMEEQALRPHGLYYRGLLAEGRLHAGGRLGENDGLAIIWAADEDEARTILRNDPAIGTGIFVGEVRLWRPRFKSPEPLPAQ